MESRHLTIRTATDDDYDVVMNINRNVYYGFDYLPARYMEYRRDPNRHMYVVEMNGKVVSVEFYSNIPEVI